LLVIRKRTKFDAVPQAKVYTAPVAVQQKTPIVEKKATVAGTKVVTAPAAVQKVPADAKKP
jgi:hypothetical protein